MKKNSYLFGEVVVKVKLFWLFIEVNFMSFDVLFIIVEIFV